MLTDLVRETVTRAKWFYACVQIGAHFCIRSAVTFKGIYYLIKSKHGQ